MCDYERQRLERMAQNRARMEVGAVPTPSGIHCYGLSHPPVAILERGVANVLVAGTMCSTRDML